MTATAMAAAQISGRQINPGQLDARLDAQGGYSGNALNWGVAARQYGLGVQSADIRNQAGMDQMNRQLDAGRPVVLGVDYRAGSNGGANGTDHWITVTGRTRDAQGNSTYTANDPNGGRQITLREQNGRLVEQNPPAGRAAYSSSGPVRTFTGGTGNPPTAAGDSYDPASPSAPAAPGAPAAPAAPGAPADPAAAGALDAITAESSTMLRNRSTGPQVEDLQTRLREAGFDPGPQDGKFGPLTQAAVRAFQQARGLPVDGVVGPQTRDALMGRTPAAPPAPGGAETPEAPAGTEAVAPITANSTLNERAQAATRYFEGQGWTREQAAGIVANLVYESGGQLNHRQAQIGGGPGFGLAQWEGPRQADFQRIMGIDIRNSTFEQQLAFVQWELNNTERGAGNALRNAGSASDAANIFLRRFERPRDPDASQAERTRLANRLFSGESI